MIVLMPSALRIFRVNGKCDFLIRQKLGKLFSIPAMEEPFGIQALFIENRSRSIPAHFSATPRECAMAVRCTTCYIGGRPSYSVKALCCRSLLSRRLVTEGLYLGSTCEQKRFN